MPRYELNEGGHWYETVDTGSLEEALWQAEDNVDRANYAHDEEPEKTLWIDVRVREVCTDADCEASGTCTCDLATDEATVTLDPEEPACDDDQEHEWHAPHEIVGGCKENPGVCGHGGGAVVSEVCMHCGCARITDSWAQRRDTGEQGLTSVRYEPGKYTDALAALNESEDEDDEDDEESDEDGA